ncbi:hypothetical protein BDR06DRAFT_976290 [Suillus hirtellus]|nr:hypothetical protein BDR06DRAFT_976290 [Suillus hirtellus]
MDHSLINLRNAVPLLAVAAESNIPQLIAAAVESNVPILAAAAVVCGVVYVVYKTGCSFYARLSAASIEFWPTRISGLSIELCLRRRCNSGESSEDLADESRGQDRASR